MWRKDWTRHSLPHFINHRFIIKSNSSRSSTVQITSFEVSYLYFLHRDLRVQRNNIYFSTFAVVVLSFFTIPKLDTITGVVVVVSRKERRIKWNADYRSLMSIVQQVLLFLFLKQTTRNTFLERMRRMVTTTTTVNSKENSTTKRQIRNEGQASRDLLLFSKLQLKSYTFLLMADRWQFSCRLKMSVIIIMTFKNATNCLNANC